MEQATDLKKSRAQRERKRALVAYSFIAPNFIGFAVFTMIPIICAFALGFLHWDGNNAIQFAGLDNFKQLLGDTIFKASLKNTIIYCIGTVPLTMIASLGLAIILNQKIKFRGFFRTVAFFPYVASLVAITAVWAMIFHPSKGPVNAVLYYVFHVKELPNWFGGNLILVTLILFSVWKYMGYYMVIYLAGLQGISAELYEAVSVDGGGWFTKFFHVTLPMVSPILFYNLLTATIAAFQVFVQPMLMTGGDYNTNYLGYSIYTTGFTVGRQGYASAMSWIMLAIVGVFVLVIQLARKRWAFYND